MKDILRWNQIFFHYVCSIALLIINLFKILHIKYEKINLLVGSTAPTYGDGSFMKGTLTKITIGDYLKGVPGFIGSVGLSWDVGSPWEIAEEGKRLPHILNCSVSFTPIHEFVPTAESKFIG